MLSNDKAKRMEIYKKIHAQKLQWHELPFNSLLNPSIGWKMLLFSSGLTAHSKFLKHIHTFCLLTSIYVLLNYASARPIMCFIALILYGHLNLTVLFKFILYMFCLLIVHVYFYVGFKCSLEFCFNCVITSTRHSEDVFSIILLS
jgi:hypothetical protein